MGRLCGQSSISQPFVKNRSPFDFSRFYITVAHGLFFLLKVRKFSCLDCLEIGHNLGKGHSFY